MHRRSALCLVAVLLCLADRIAAQAPRITENPRPTWTAAQTLRLSAKPTLVVGTSPGAMYEFSRVAGAARLKDGRIVVADGGSNTLRFFDSTGKFLKIAGGRGEGPGEFQALEYFTIAPGDTLVAGSQTRALATFTGTGQFIQQRTSASLQGAPPPPPGATNAQSARPSAIIATLAVLDGSGTRAITAWSNPAPRSGTAHWIDSMPVTIVDGKNATIAQLGRLPGMEATMEDGSARSVWFGASAITAGSGDRFYIGYGSEYAIRVYNGKGVLQQIIRRAWRPAAVTKKDIDSYVVEWGKRWIKSTGAEAEAERVDLRNDPYASTVPAFAQFIIDRIGRLWVRDVHLADVPRNGSLNGTPIVPSNWSVFDPAGRWLGEVGMPAQFLPRDIGADYVLGIARDEDDVPTIAVYRLGTGRP